MKRRQNLSQNVKQKRTMSLTTEKETSPGLLPSGNSITVATTKKQLKNPSSSQEMSLQQKKHFSYTQYNSDLLNFLNDDRQKLLSFCDLNIIVSGKQYSAHKVVVAFGSSYFHAHLSKNPNINHVTVDHVADSVFQHLLQFLYTSEFLIHDSEIPSLLEAAKFLDMIEAVKVLSSKEYSVVSLHEQEVAEEIPCSESSQTALESISKIPSNNQCTFCSRTFCYRKSLENHLAKSHNKGEKSEEDCRNSETDSLQMTRRSARTRKCPAKFDQIDNESGSLSDENSLSRVFSEDEKSNPTEMEDSENVSDEEEDAENEESSDESGAEHQSNNEEEDQNIDAEVPDHDYPEGLAPVIIHSANKKTLKCPKCNKTFDRAGKYESHTRVHTGEKPFECDICHQCYSTKSNLTVHRKKHNNEAPFQKKEHKCPFCNKLHASKKTLAKHVKRFHPDHIQEFLSMKKRKSEGWKCDICNKSFTRRPHLEEHMILHTQDRPFKCSYCDDHFKSRFARLKHQEKFHLGPFPCDICGRQFNDTGNRKRHIECTHGGKRKWTCFICGKSVRERTTLKEHLRIHSGEKPHLCSICGQSFRHGSSYRLHLRVHHDDKRYECDECGKTFIRHDHLTKHKKIHSGEKAHQCEECGKCFGRRDHLTVHYRSVHLGEKVWQKYKAAVHQCEVCKKEFKGKSSLEMHFRTHSGEKPYRCHICNQMFRIKKTLTKHMVIHSDARPFNCPHCSATFKRKDKLKYHIDHVHGTKAAEQPTADQLEDKMVSLPVPYDGKVYHPEQSKVYRPEPKTILQNVSSDVCVPVTLVPVQMPDVSSQTDLVRHTTPLPAQSHNILSPQPQGQQTEYQPATDLVFLEKYTLTPQPANIVHPVRPDQILDPREQSYLGTLLGLDTSAAVQNISNSDHGQ
uniref:Zinc finger and BTB domain-containing protein 41 n=1 Tax=Lepisosteus oculatus TaxID=7918 RepID=W5ML60_LEPOC|nr:PREDICTED: zinc finger and BTB domain-containing protein 41 [Lepisosteus oculatus]XP_015211177.1 PREDICTED: zinc finger and BTB domain-containing protein 41 [Lepisosteus oculatus]XP_015211178.1 PREDICTED: zinc finger and BTB domain-containing protein 41 [Lepisosteus oculatus]XP_015211179.1 PREDICTED: zinc finger and BTB domain-containing protein 41 [Lepisosteus oculatus]